MMVLDLEKRMVKIIERGTRRKRGTRRIQICDNCGCKFSFEAEDIVTRLMKVMVVDFIASMLLVLNVITK